MRLDTKHFFEHEEIKSEEVDFLGKGKTEISGFQRLGNFDADSRRVKQMLVKLEC